MFSILTLPNSPQDFLAPEYALSDSCSPASDMFSLGMVAFTLYNTKPLYTNSGNWGIYKKNAGEVNDHPNVLSTPAQF